MGVNNYLASLSKEEYQELSNLSYEDLKSKYTENDGYFGILSLPFSIVYTLGDLDNDIMDKVLDNKESVFNKYDSREAFTTNKIHILNQEDLMIIIEYFKSKIVKSYQNLQVNTLDYGVEKIAEDKLKDFIENRISIWENFNPIDTSTNKDIITRSSLYEYAIFQIIYIMKNFDFTNNYLIHYQN